ncbi:MAG: hypothetical protein AB9880_06025 [Christensenellales bacterium]
MERIDQVETLRQKAGVSYEAAKAALENSRWDLLDALVSLEKEGRIDKGSTEAYTGKQETEERRETRESGGGVFHAIAESLKAGIKRLNAVSFQICRNGSLKCQISLTAFLLITLITHGFFLPWMLVSLLFGISYRFRDTLGEEGAQPEGGTVS